MVDIVVRHHRVERHRAQQRRPDFRVRRVGIIDRIKMLGVLAVPSAFIDVVAGVDDDVRVGLVRIIRDRPLARIAVRVVPERDKPRRFPALLAGGKVPLGDHFSVAPQAVIIDFAQTQATEAGGVIEPLVRVALPALGPADRRGLAVGFGQAIIQRKFGRHQLRLPGDYCGLLPRRQPARGAGLDIWQSGELGECCPRRGEEAAPGGNKRQKRDAAGGAQKIASGKLKHGISRFCVSNLGAHAQNHRETVAGQTALFYFPAVNSCKYAPVGSEYEIQTAWVSGSTCKVCDLRCVGTFPASVMSWPVSWTTEITPASPQAQYSRCVLWSNAIWST